MNKRKNNKKKKKPRPQTKLALENTYTQDPLESSSIPRFEFPPSHFFFTQNFHRIRFDPISENKYPRYHLLCFALLCFALYCMYA